MPRLGMRGVELLSGEHGSRVLRLMMVGITATLEGGGNNMGGVCWRCGRAESGIWGMDDGLAMVVRRMKLEIVKSRGNHVTVQHLQHVSLRYYCVQFENPTPRTDMPDSAHYLQ
jgi:hypothetical protein